MNDSSLIELGTFGRGKPFFSLTNLDDIYGQ